MINHWWRRAFGREPKFEDLTDAQRIVVLARVLPLRMRWDFGVNVFLVLWIVGVVAAIAFAGIAARQFLGAWMEHERRLFVPLLLYVMLPVYALGLRKAVLARATRRATIRAVRDDRLETIRSIIDGH